MPEEPWMEEFLDAIEKSGARVQVWFCPRRREHGDEPDRPTVQWRDGVAYCLHPGCGQTSARKGI